MGQTIQFQLRDPAAADEDRRELLTRVRTELGSRQPVGELLCSCNGRGIGLFGPPDHDAARNFLHGFTASIALVIPEEAG